MCAVFLYPSLWAHLQKVFQLHDDSATEYMWVFPPVDRTLNAETENLFSTDTSASTTHQLKAERLAATPFTFSTIKLLQILN